MSVHSSILDCIGATPLVRLERIAEGLDIELFGKCEFQNPGGSVKDRAALAMIDAAERAGLIHSNTTIIEPTSGNTGIALALVCAVKGYPLIITMPDSMSLERRQLLQAYGARVELTPGHLQMEGAIQAALDLAKQCEHAYIPQQFQNPANPDAHYHSTGEEIWKDTNGQVDGIVVAVGTGGSVSGISRYLKEKNPDLITVAVEPEDSAVIAGKKPGPHMIQGIGAGFVPKNLDRDQVDHLVTVSNEAAMQTARDMAVKEGLLCGISSGANVAASLALAKDPKFQGKRLVTILCDIGDRYFSTNLFPKAKTTS